MAAFERSFSLGFGTETDFRDSLNRLVIAHDLPGPSAEPADLCFECLAKHDRRLPLAINIKSDGLQALLKASLDRYGISNYFLFDMSVPDAIVSLRFGLRVYTRHSDVERVPAFYEQATGVWMDAFYDDSWLIPSAIEAHLSVGKKVCLVSPELHKRPYLEFWERLRSSRVCADDRLTLCTDIPETAVSFFNHA